MLTSNVILAMVCLVAAAGLAKVRGTIQDVPVVKFGSTLAPETPASEPRNFLIIGTDSAEGLPEDSPVLKNRSLGGQLADVIMIVRVDPRDHSVKLLSIPRDSRVELAPSGRMARINAAMSGVGGEVNLVQTIKRNFAVRIDNYVQVNFEAFRELVDVLGGVPVYFTTPVRDRHSGLSIETPGCRMLDPDQALSYARARHLYFYQDGKWRPDGSSDLGRISRQQDFIKRALRRAAEKGLRNPTSALGIINAAAGAVRMDDELDVGTLLALAKEFQSFNPEDIDSMQVPTHYSPRGGVDYQEIDRDGAEPMLEKFRGVDPQKGVQVQNVIVSVASRTADDEELDPIVEKLDTAGFDADRFDDNAASRTTTIRYGLKGRDAAILLAAQLQVVPQFEFDEDLLGYRVELDVGNDFEGVRDQAIPVGQIPADQLPDPVPVEDESASTSTSVDNGGTSSSVDTIESDEDSPADETDEPGIVPTDPEASAACR